MAVTDSSGVPMDGFVIDAEAEYIGQSANAITYCQGLRTQFPNRFLAHAPYPIPSNYPMFPYIEFGQYCDAVFPQDYWYDQLGTTPEDMLSRQNSDFIYWQNIWLSNGHASSVKPLYPIGQGFQGNSPVPIPGSELTRFYNAVKSASPCATAGGYQGISFWSCQHHTTDEWNAIAAMTFVSLPVITNPPVSLVCTQGNPAAFTVVAGPAPLNYQWRKNGGDVSGATASALTLAGVTTNDAASYTVMVNNLAGSVTSAVATLTVLAPPAITIEPQSSGLCQGAPAALTLGATGTAPLFYQWRWNSFSFAPGTGGSPCTVYNPGSYSCVVSNRVGMVTSDVAVLSVTYPPAITNPLPAAAVVVQGSCSNLSVGAGGTAPVYYQWHWNSTAFSASTAASAWSACSAGSYWCVLSNSCGMATSAVTVLSVVMPPVVTSQPQSRTNLAGWGSLMSVGASGTGPLYYQWHWNDTVYPPDTASSLMAYNAGSYWVGISNLSGMGTQSATALLVLTNALPGRFEAIERLSDGSVALRMSGTAGTNYTLLWTRDWSNWPGLGPLSSGDGRFDYTDLSATNASSRFYRLRLGL